MGTLFPRCTYGSGDRTLVGRIWSISDKRATTDLFSLPIEEAIFFWSLTRDSSRTVGYSTAREDTIAGAADWIMIDLYLSERVPASLIATES